MKVKEGNSICKAEVKSRYVWLDGDRMLTNASNLDKQATEDAKHQIMELQILTDSKQELENEKKKWNSEIEGCLRV